MKADIKVVKRVVLTAKSFKRNLKLFKEYFPKKSGANSLNFKAGL